MAMTSQSFVKHLLTEGDKFAVSMVSTLEDQGAYAIASNYGAVNSYDLQCYSLTRLVSRFSRRSNRLSADRGVEPGLLLQSPCVRGGAE